MSGIHCQCGVISGALLRLPYFLSPGQLTNTTSLGNININPETSTTELQPFPKQAAFLSSMASASSPTIQHPSLGTIKGLLVENERVEQFRGIPFGSIPGRWRDPLVLSGKLGPEVFDATRFGPICPQGVGGQEGDVAFVGDMKLEVAQNINESETDCLNLVISRPAGLPLDAKVPVMVW